MDETRDAIDELKEYVDTCATREDFDRLIAKIEQERDKLLRSLDMARESRDRKAARLKFLSERGILLAVDGQGGMELVIDPERCRHDEDRVMRVNDYRRLKDSRDEWRAKAEQAMESYQDAKDSRDETRDELDALREYLDESEHEQSMYGDRIRTLLRKLDAAQERIDMLESTLDDTARERDELRKGNEILARREVVELPMDADRICKLECELDDMRKERDVLHKERDELKASLDYEVEVRMALAEWRQNSLPLPVDADGEYIHVGDMVKTQGLQAKKVEAISDGHVWVNLYESPMYQLISLPGGDCRRVHAPTVADVLREFAAAWDEWKDGSPHDPFAKYASKLRLKGE